MIEKGKAVATDCIFCKIITKEIPSSPVFENEHVLVIPDIAPKAPIHYLILPKQHVESVAHLADHDSQISWEIMRVARDLGKKIGNKGFNLVSNNGASAGQSVFHLHFHFLAGKNLYQEGGLQL
ncbi:MAG: HIT domain-containing protein [Epsilonproteobacteria bacterium]|nr:HIT domain-containing protein [Campylobacterota bacterium]